MTDEKADGALACLVDLRHPPTEPSDAYGRLDRLARLRLHPERGFARRPGRFAAGRGRAPPASLRFGDFQCRSDADGLFCVNFAHQSEVKFADSGVEPLGCSKMVDAPDLGLKFSC